MACTDAIATQELASTLCSLDIEAQVIESLNQRQSTLLVGIGDSNEDSTIVRYADTRRLQRLIQRTIQALVVTYGLTLDFISGER